MTFFAYAVYVIQSDILSGTGLQTFNHDRNKNHISLAISG